LVIAALVIAALVIAALVIAALVIAALVIAALVIAALVIAALVIAALVIAALVIAALVIAALVIAALVVTALVVAAADIGGEAVSWKPDGHDRGDDPTCLQQHTTRFASRLLVSCIRHRCLRYLYVKTSGLAQSSCRKKMPTNQKAWIAVLSEK
jgi:hypothetical protein